MSKTKSPIKKGTNYFLGVLAIIAGVFILNFMGYSPGVTNIDFNDRSTGTIPYFFFAITCGSLGVFYIFILGPIIEKRAEKKARKEREAEAVTEGE